MNSTELWNIFAVDQKEVESGSVREIILESWKRSRKLNVDPYFKGVVRIPDEELLERRKKSEDLLAAAMPHLHKLYKIISKSRTTITLTDEDGVILETFYNNELKKMKNFPIAGTLHSEKTCGTNGIGTTLHTGRAIQIIGSEHWLHDNHDWFCNTAPIIRQNRIIGTLNLSCPVDMGHEHSLGMVTATAYAIEREMEMNKVLKERKNLVSLQKAIIELLDTGIIVINEEGEITQYNDKAQKILENRTDWSGSRLWEIIECAFDFSKAFANRTELENFEIPVKIGSRHLYIGFSTAFIESGGITKGMVLRLREPAAIRHFAAIAGGSNAIYNFDDIIGKSDMLSEALKIAQLASRNNTNVLITGESGTGKELIAQSIHNASSRSGKPFVAINCGALSRELIQSELFGYEGGAFTGAKKNGNPGKFEIADGGTLFLDEIGEMPLDAQTNLLRVLQTGMVLRIGGSHPNRVDVRIIAATNKNLEAEIECKNFRNDLFYRLNVLQIRLPSLRERKDDIEILISHFLKRFTTEMKLNISGFTPQATEILKNYNWPGNIRELENSVERAVIICENNLIDIGDLPHSITDGCTEASLPSSASSSTTRAVQGIDRVELEYIEDLLRRHLGNLRAASAEMGVARSTLYNKIKKYGIDPDGYRG